MDQAKLDDYLRRGKALFDGELIDGATLDQREDYKSGVIEDLVRARKVVLAGDDGWLDLVKTGITIPRGSPIYFTTKDDFLKVSASQPDSVLRALRMLWVEGDEQPADRIRAFFDSMPIEYEEKPTGGKGNVWTRLSLVALLLMGLGSDYPPVMRSRFMKVWNYLEHPRPSRDADEGGIYEHTLDFLDKIREQSRTLGYERPYDRLDAQSLVWTMHGFLENGEIKPPPPNGTNNPNPLTERLVDLSDELLLDPTSFLSETVWPLLEDKKQVIFQGPPGTGKTWVARKLAECLAGSNDRVRIVQFHPSYAYEDFVQGFRPVQGDGQQVGFELRNGPLLQMAGLAESEPKERHFLVIDEINRGNLGKILGELYFLLEYRKERMHLQYSDEPFTMPPNLYIIGTMNTADRSIALVDLALRRRFHFVEFHPDKEPIKGLLGRWLADEAPDMKWIADLVDAANEKLGEQRREAAIGPTYFMRPSLDETRARRIWEHNVLPYVEEQLYGEPGTLNEIKALWSGANADSEAPDEGDGEQVSGQATPDGDAGD